MWPFKRTKPPTGIKARCVDIVDGVAIIDVRGQTCPGYLLAINREVEKLAQGMKAQLLISYPPCGDDVKAWCKEKQVEFLDMEQQDGLWKISIQK